MQRRTIARRSLFEGAAVLGAGAIGLGLRARSTRGEPAHDRGVLGAPRGCDPLALLPPVPAFTLTSSDVSGGQPLPQAQLSGIAGAGGQDLSPALAWSGFPDATASFAVTMYDADAATGSGFWHWALVDLPASVTALATGAGAPGDAALPAGAFQLRNDLGLPRYLGAAPPPGDGPHRYFIVVHAVDVASLGVDHMATPAFLGFMVSAHALGRAVLGAYSRALTPLIPILSTRQRNA